MAAFSTFEDAVSDSEQTGAFTTAKVGVGWGLTDCHKQIPELDDCKRTYYSV